MPAPETEARQAIDRQLQAAGWSVQDANAVNLYAGPGVAIREFRLDSGFGRADYLLYVDARAVGVIEAKPAGTTLTGVEPQARKYSEGLPAALPSHTRPLPFLYQSTGVETRFTSLMDPEPRSRTVFHFHRPETLLAWVTGVTPAAQAVATPGSTGGRIIPTSQPAYGSTSLRAGFRTMPPLPEAGLWPAQVRAIHNLERSLVENRPRALIQMATGSGKTYTAVNAIYRMVKHAGVRRVLFPTCTTSST